MTAIVSLADAGGPALAIGMIGGIVVVGVAVVAWIIWLFKRKI